MVPAGVSCTFTVRGVGVCWFGIAYSTPSGLAAFVGFWLWEKHVESARLDISGLPLTGR